MCCREEKDTSIPVIIYQAPQFRQEFTVNDTIEVSASITDKQVITYVKVNLTDKDFTPVSASRTFAPNSPSFDLKTQLWIDDLSLQSGTYYVLIRAENEEEFKNQYQEIILHGPEQEFRQLLVVTAGGSNGFSVHGTEDLDTSAQLLTIAGDYAGSDISLEDQLLFVAGVHSPNVQAYDLGNYSLAWEKEIPPGQPVHNNDCLYFQELLYTTYYYDYIQGYSPSGQLDFNVFTEDFDSPERIFRHKNLVLVEMQKKNAVDPYIGTYFAATGNLKQKRFINFDITDFHSMDDDRVIILSNKEGHGIIHTYDVGGDILTFMMETDDPVHASVTLGNGLIAIAGEGFTYSYNANTNLLVKLLDKGGSSIAYEHLSGLLFLGNANKIDIYKFPEMVNQKTLLFSDTIFEMHVQYSE